LIFLDAVDIALLSNEKIHQHATSSKVGFRLLGLAQLHKTDLPNAELGH
jgi:hypothetical protein